ncbi:MAG: hypothetical protein U0736_20845 [Gemmataceae bacterium]
MLEQVADVLEPTLVQTPPNLLRPRLRDLWRLPMFFRAFQAMERAWARRSKSSPARPVPSSIAGSSPSN